MLLLKSEAMVIRIGVKKQMSTKHVILLFAAILIPGYQGELPGFIFYPSGYTFVTERICEYIIKCRIIVYIILLHVRRSEIKYNFNI